MRKLVTFDKAVKKQMLELLDKKADGDGFIIEKETGQRVLTPTGEEVSLENFAGMKKGSEIFIKSDIAALIDFAKKSSP